MRGSRALCCVASVLMVACASTCLGQIGIGVTGGYGGNLTPNSVTTSIQSVLGGAQIDGAVTSATFGWSNSPCLAAAKIKFFRPTDLSNPQAFTFLTERGPFDVTVPRTSPSSSPPVHQTVALDPPVSLHAGDVIAITNLTTCGGPTFVYWVPLLNPLPPPASVVYAGDVTGTVLRSVGLPEPGIDLIATGASSALVFFRRFEATLLAVDPRTLQQAAGVPVQLQTSSGSTGAGYFSLPEFTGDPLFPEVVIKMVDATGVPALGGTFWFFHAPLTDVQYTITVTDLNDRTVRTYTNSSVTPGQLCGGVDTSAFPGP